MKHHCPKLIKSLIHHYCFRSFLSGMLLPFGFAPFHLPGLAILGVALLFAQLSSELSTSNSRLPKRSFYLGFNFGLGYFGFGVSWVFVSIHNYGHLNILVSAIITFIFIAYLAVFMGLLGYLYRFFAINRSKFISCLLFSALWCLCEYLRSTILTGFPWILLGFGQIDTPLIYILPIIGVYGVSFLTALVATFLTVAFQEKKLKSLPWLFGFVGLLLAPLILKNKSWITEGSKPISVGIIQANLSMRDKWDEQLFWKLLDYYRIEIQKLVGKDELIVLPESAIPAPESYASDFLEAVHFESLNSNTSVLLGIPTEPSEHVYYNSLIALGDASGTYQKKQLVPFGEYIPKTLQFIMDWLSIPLTNISAGAHNQPLVQVNYHPIATLICYELAYPLLLREQLPEAEWIVSISDDGWFGRTFAMYQQQQMAQVLSVQTGRYQIIANNDGLSSVINSKGEIVNSLKAYQAGVLQSHLYPSLGATPWVTLGDTPILLFSLLVVLGALLQRGYAVKLTVLSRFKRKWLSGQNG